MKTVALIMAGGKGERFWPKSRNLLPKQFLQLDKGEGTMLQQTVRRIQPLVNLEDVFILTGAIYKNLVKKQLPDIPNENIICEPISKNTAPAIGLGVEHVHLKYKDCVMFVLPSDHLIMNEKEYQKVLEEAKKFAEKNDALITIGIDPSEPNTGYGYIKLGEEIKKNRLYKVDEFKEKPDLKTAKKYISSGNYLWNSGMFVWKMSTINEAFKKFLPKQHQDFTWLFNQSARKRCKNYNRVFSEQESISIDYGIMQKADNIFVVASDFGWDDVGSWLSLERINGVNDDKNSIIGDNVVTYNTTETIINSTGKKLIATVGINDLVIVETDDVFLVSTKKDVSNVKEIIKKLKEEKKDKYI